MSLLPTPIPEYDENKGACFSDAVLGADGCVYGIPFYSRRFVRLDPKDDSVAEFGSDVVSDLGFGSTTLRYGVLADDGFIYVLQRGSKFMLKVNTNKGEGNGVITTLRVEYPEDQMLPRMPSSGIKGPAGYLFFPLDETQIMVFDSVSGQATFPFPSTSPLSLSGGINIHENRLIALPSEADDPEVLFSVDLLNDSPTGRILENTKWSWQCVGGSVVTRPGHLCFLNQLGQVVSLTSSWSGYSFAESAPVEFEEGAFDNGNWEFGSPCLGSDGCVYWPPLNQERILKYDPYLDTVDFIGVSTPTDHRWSKGVTAPNGKTYFFPYFGGAKQILVVDPLGDFQKDLFKRIERDPFKFGGMFQGQTDELVNSASRTTYNVGVWKFGENAMMQILDDCIQKIEEVYNRSGCPVALWAALCEDCPLDVLYHLMRDSIGEMKYHLERSISLTAKEEEKETSLVKLLFGATRTQLARIGLRTKR